MSIVHNSEILNLSRLAEYQTGAIVSCQISKTEGGNITLFAFDEGQELSEHTVPFEAFVQVLDGETEIRISGNPNHLKAGDAIIMPAGAPHAVKAVSKFKMILTMIKK